MIKPVKRRAVGGLISLIGIIVVFGVVSVAYLELSSAQTNFINTSLLSNQKISDKNNAMLNITDIATSGKYDIIIDNMGSDPVTIHSYLVKRDNSIIDKAEVDTLIPAADDDVVSTNSFTTQPSSDTLLIITVDGKKCSIPADVSYRLC